VCNSARDIQRYSAMRSAECEFVVPPGCCWRVESKCDAGHGLTIVQLTELPHKNMLTFKPPGSLFPPLSPSAAAPPASAGAAAASGDDVEEELQELVSEMMKLKLGLKKACVTIARSLAEEGLMSLERLRPMQAQDARDILQSAGMKKLQIDAVVQAFCSFPAPAPAPAPAHAPAPAPEQAAEAAAAKKVHEEAAAAQMKVGL